MGLLVGVTTAPATAQPAVRDLDLAGPAFFAVSVANLDASVTWYTRVLGVETVRTVEGPAGRTRAVILRRGDLAIELIGRNGSLSINELRGPAAHRYDVQGLVKTGFFVTDAVRVHEQLIAAGVDADARVGMDSTLGARTFVFRDPDGNRIQVFERD